PASSVQLDPSNSGSTARPETLHWRAASRSLRRDSIRRGQHPSRRHNLGTIVLRRFQIRLVRGADEFREALLEERRESLDCVEKSAGGGSSGRVQTFVAAHYHTENRLTGYICAAFSEMIDQQSLQTFAIAVHTGEEELSPPSSHFPSLV
uniref:N-acetyltransferase domain-containing protein n=1 Tax=Macrostomum lignano TaxID=282301 RepID=A0A1I8F4L4_9PLAT